MYRIGILGTENSHAGVFAKLFRDDPAFRDMKLVAVGGHYPESNQKMCEEFGIDTIVERPEDMVGMVDAVMITARDGKYHLPFARPFLEAGIPMFIDKPFSVDEQEALDFAREAKRRGVPLAGGSILKCAYDAKLLQNEAQTHLDDVKGGTVTAPVKMNSEHSGFFFYSSHLAELSLMIFGQEPLSVTAHRHGENVTAVVDYEGFSVANCFVGGFSQYGAQIFRSKSIYTRDVDLAFSSRELALGFAHMLRTGEMPQSYRDLVYPVIYLNAIKRSYETGETVILPKVEL